MQSLFVFISVTPERLLDVAKKCRVRTIDGKLLYDSTQMFHDDLSDREDHDAKLQTQLGSDKLQENSHLDARSLFTMADILWMIRHEIDNVRSDTKQILQVGKSKMTLFQGQSIGKKTMQTSNISHLPRVEDSYGI